jgi:hypothetical protein
MSGISSCIDAMEAHQLGQADARRRRALRASLRDARRDDDDGTFTDESREVVYRGPEELGDEETRETA